MDNSELTRRPLVEKRGTDPEAKAVPPDRLGECNHIIGFLLEDVPDQLRVGHQHCGLIQASDIAALIENCRSHFMRHPSSRCWTERYLVVDDDREQLRALIHEFQFCPLCGKRLL